MSQDILESDTEPLGTDIDEELEERVKPFQALGASAAAYATSTLTYGEVRNALDISEPEIYKSIVDNPVQTQEYLSQAAAYSMDNPDTALATGALAAASAVFVGIGTLAGREGVKELYSRSKDNQEI